MKTLTALFATALLLTAIAARADDSEIQPGEILSALIAGSATAVLADASGEPMNEKLADILGNALAVDIMKARKGKSTVLNSVSGKCVATDVGKYGVAYYDCSLTILDGDYKVTRRGYEGPDLESSRTFIFQGAKQLEGGKLHMEGQTVTVHFAG